MDGLAQPLSVVRVVRLGLRLGLFQLSLGILGVLILGLLNRLLITEIGVSAALTIDGSGLRCSATDGVQPGLVR